MKKKSSKTSFFKSFRLEHIIAIVGIPLFIVAVTPVIQDFTGAASTCSGSSIECYKELKITEVMYNPAGQDYEHEWVEIRNNDNNSIDLSSYSLKVNGIEKSLSNCNIYETDPSVTNNIDTIKPIPSSDNTRCLLESGDRAIVVKSLSGFLSRYSHSDFGRIPTSYSFKIFELPDMPTLVDTQNADSNVQIIKTTTSEVVALLFYAENGIGDGDSYSIVWEGDSPRRSAAPFGSPGIVDVYYTDYTDVNLSGVTVSKNLSQSNSYAVAYNIEFNVNLSGLSEIPKFQVLSGIDEYSMVPYGNLDNEYCSLVSEVNYSHYECLIDNLKTDTKYVYQISILKPGFEVQYNNTNTFDTTQSSDTLRHQVSFQESYDYNDAYAKGTLTWKSTSSEITAIKLRKIGETNFTDIYQMIDGSADLGIVREHELILTNLERETIYEFYFSADPSDKDINEDYIQRFSTTPATDLSRIITGVNVNEISSSSKKIQWNLPAYKSGQVLYGYDGVRTKGVEKETATTGQSIHEVTINGLSNSNYGYLIEMPFDDDVTRRSYDIARNKGSLQESNVSPEFIQYPTSNITNDGVVISLTTNVTDAKLYYKKQSDSSYQTLTHTLENQYQDFNLTNLEGNTIYDYHVEITKNAQTKDSGDFTFRTTASSGSSSSVITSSSSSSSSISSSSSVSSSSSSVSSSSSSSISSSSSSTSSTYATEDILITEVMYNPRSSNEEGREWVEVYNDSNSTENLENWFLEVDGTRYQIEKAYEIDLNELKEITDFNLRKERYAVIIEDPTVFFETYDDVMDDVYDYDDADEVRFFEVSGDFDMDNAEGTIRILNEDYEEADEFNYEDDYGNEDDDGEGYSLERIDLERSNSKSNWDTSDHEHGTPGLENSIDDTNEDDDDNEIVITEIMYHPDDSDEEGKEWVEIYNNGDEEVDMDGWYLEIDDDNEYEIMQVFEVRSTGKLDDITEEDDAFELEDGAYAVIIDDEDEFEDEYEDEIEEMYEADEDVRIYLVDGDFDLDNTEGIIRILDTYRDEIDEAEYEDDYGDNDDHDGDGHTLERLDIDGSDKESNWETSEEENGTPGRENSVDETDYDYDDDESDIYIYNIEVDAKKDKITLAWETRLQAQPRVYYGTTESLTETRYSINEMSKPEITLTDVEPNTTYFYKLQSTRGGDTHQTNLHNITTTNNAYSTNNLSDIRAKVETSSVAISFITEQTSTAIVRYGFDKNNLDTEKTSANKQEHTVYIAKPSLYTQNLFLKTVHAANETLYYQVEVGEGNEKITSSILSVNVDGISTGGTGIYNPLEFSEVFVDASATTAIVRINSNLDTRPTVSYGETQNLGDSALSGKIGKVHSIVLRNLKPGTSYYYKVIDGTTSTLVRSFTTLSTSNNPIAKIATPIVTAHGKVDFDASISNYIPSDAVYKWDFDSSNGTTQIDATGVKTQYVYPRNATYVVTLRIETQAGELLDQTSVQVVVNNIGGVVTQLPSTGIEILLLIVFILAGSVYIQKKVVKDLRKGRG